MRKQGETRSCCEQLDPITRLTTCIGIWKINNYIVMKNEKPECDYPNIIECNYGFLIIYYEQINMIKLWHVFNYLLYVRTLSYYFLLTSDQFTRIQCLKKHRYYTCLYNPYRLLFRKLG